MGEDSTYKDERQTGSEKTGSGPEVFSSGGDALASSDYLNPLTFRHHLDLDAVICQCQS